MDENKLLEAIKSIVQAEVQPIRDDMEMVKAKQNALSADIATLNHEIVPKINHMYDAMTGVQEKFDKLDRLELVQEHHDDRIFALEQWVKEA